MALKRRTKVNEAFSMASMTDVIFLLLIFFMVTSTVVIPNAIKVTLPQAQKQTAAKPLTRVTIDANLNYYVAFGKQKEVQVSFDEITLSCKIVTRRNRDVRRLICRRDRALQRDCKDTEYSERE